MQNSQRLERDVRCDHCGKLFCRIVYDVYWPDWLLTNALKHGIRKEDSDSVIGFLAKMGIDLKFGIETKCPRAGCRELDYKILVA